MPGQSWIAVDEQQLASSSREHWMRRPVTNHSSAPTLILTAELDAESFDWLNGLRRTYFPPERSVLSAHLTMFHRLSQQQAERLREAPLPSNPVMIAFDAVAFLGFGNAILVSSQELTKLRGKLKDAIGDGLSQQDDRHWSPHVTIQNKVTADEARRLNEALVSRFILREGSVLGLLVWEYLGGPWRLKRRLPFTHNEQ